MPTLVEQRQERGALIEQQRAILKRADDEKRELTAEEQAEDDRLFDASERLKTEIGRRERHEAQEREMAERADPVSRPAPAGARAEDTVPERYRALYRRSSPEVRGRLVALSSSAYRAAFSAWIDHGQPAFDAALAEHRNLQQDLFTKGGALVPPLEFVSDLIKAIDDAVYVRQYATTKTVVTSDGIGVATLDTDPADADWTSELLIGNEATMAFGRREIRPHPLAKWMTVSNKLMRTTAGSIETLVRDRLGFKFGVAGEKGFLTGNGVQQPLGVFTASADGVPTSQDVSTDNTTTAITADGLINAKHEIKSSYWPRLRWTFSRPAIRNIRKLKDGNGQYLWAPGLSGGIPDRILETPYDVSEFCPATFTTGLYVGLICDWSQYWIVDALEMTMQRLVELKAATNQTMFVGRRETDGQPVLAEAFVRVKLA